MARQKSIIQYAGKLGNTVGMKNGFGGQEAFTRVYVETINNPQTDPQIEQRAKMLPAVLFRRQLASVIERAWEGKEYGGPSTREFMKYALKEPWPNIPQLPKDSTLPIPGAYLVSRGSLPPIGIDVSTTFVSTSLEITQMGETVAALSTELLNKNSYLREGDQLTFIMACIPDDSLSYVNYVVASLFIDTSNGEPVRTALGSEITLDTEGGKLIFASAPYLGATCVLSREGTRTPQRSTQRFVIRYSTATDYFADYLKEEIAATYRTSAARSSAQDWPYESGGGSGATTNVRIRAAAYPAGWGTIVGAGTYAKGSLVTLTALPGAVYSFDKWTAGGETLSNEATYSFQAWSDMEITANFLENERP